MNSQMRVKEGINYGMIYTLIIMFVGFVGVEIFVEPFAKIFGLSGEITGLCVSAIRVRSISYFFAGANMAFQGIFQALDNGVEFLIISVCRQFIFVVPVAWVFTRFVIVSSLVGLVWTTFLIAEGIS